MSHISLIIFLKLAAATITNENDSLDIPDGKISKPKSKPKSMPRRNTQMPSTRVRFEGLDTDDATSSDATIG